MCGQIIIFSDYSYRSCGSWGYFLAIAISWFSWVLLGHIWGLLGFPRLSWVLPGSLRFLCIFQVFLGSPELSWSLLDFLSFLELSWALSGFPGAFLGSRRLSWILGLYLGSKRKASEASEGLRTGSSAQGEYEQYSLITVMKFSANYFPTTATVSPIAVWKSFGINLWLQFQ